ncbi:IS3 family transposase [Sinorhizobium sp. RAC02]|uniref:IS3 family transposase n=1 Tax=Sinorhizobium sp. RAC02 TaxID=1842534 RepID=UPI00083D7069|nr:IS3 family transposase [Sinorhizobium sp. RAC02]AOF94478.1 transposase family protein [Sinorhizobium sp. RAC02]
MYSYADRIRAVELYIKLGKRVKATIRQLGYPTKNALKAWCREYEQHRDLRARCAAKTPKYSEAQKQAAVEHYLCHDRCIASTMRDLGYPGRGTLTAWIREAFPEARTSIVGRSWRPAYPEALKQAGVIGLCSGEESAQDVADRLGVCRPTLYNWKNQLLGHEAPSSMKRRNTSPPAPDREELERQLEALQRDVRQLQLEHDLLKKANELLKKGLGVDLPLLSNREKTRLVDALKDLYRLPELLAQLRLPRSSYFYHRARASLADKYVAIRRSIIEIFETNHRCYGYRRLQASLARERVMISEKVVQRLMKQESLIVPRPKRRRFGSYLGEISPAPENLINRDFQAEAPNQKWLTDITEFQIPAGKVYLSPIIDCFDGMVISWSIGTQPDAGLVNTMLEAAIETVADVDARPIVHSDRGAHYRWPGWLTRIGNAKLVRSMSRKGCSQDNAACEGFFGRLKTELFYPRDWRATTIEQFVREVDAYIHWYNEKRIKLSLGALSPIEYRNSLGLNA